MILLLAYGFGCVTTTAARSLGPPTLDTRLRRFFNCVGAGNSGIKPQRGVTTF